MDNSLNQRILSATKWSAITELLAKLVVPVTNMILARLLAPEVFGIVATVNMVVSFCDMLTTAGFQKYLVQHAYESDEELYRGASVAFWTNMGLSMMLWAFLIVFRDEVAALAGNPGYGTAIAVAGASLPITAFSSIQTALYQRKLEYKSLFIKRLCGIAAPIVVTVPLAVLGFSYWSLIIGTIAGYGLQALVLTLRSDWKPRLYFSLPLLRQMLSFSIWTILETFALWLCGWIDIFIIGNTMGSYYTGLYKTGQSTVTGILAIITSVTTSVLFSSLSKVQADEERFEEILLNFQRAVAVFVLPLGAGMYLYRGLVTNVLLGSQWMEAADFIGIWGLCTAIVSVYGTVSREAYRAKGKPKIALIVQMLHLLVIIPSCLYGVQHGFTALTRARSFAHVMIVLLHMVFMKQVIHFRVEKMFLSTAPCIASTLVMCAVSWLLGWVSSSYLWQWVSIFICMGVYFCTLCRFPSFNGLVKDIVAGMRKKNREG